MAFPVMLKSSLGLERLAVAARAEGVGPPRRGRNDYVL